jgi:hypothetical protein
MAYSKTTQAFSKLDDVTRYVFHNYFYLLTEFEKLAWKTCLAMAKGEASGDKDYERFLSDKFGSRRSQVLALLTNGAGSFFVGVRDRALKEHKDKIVLNYCPRCGALSRTSRARICPKCSHNWRTKCKDKHDLAGSKSN